MSMKPKSEKRILNGSVIEKPAFEKTVFERPKCAECGKPLDAHRASYEIRRRLYCSSCEAVAKVKETWQPMFAGGSIAGVYTIDSNGKIVPARR